MGSIVKCSNCQAEIDDALRYCPSCEEDVGCPNVRAAISEKDDLRRRFDSAREMAKKDGLEAQFDQLVSILQKGSHVVVAMPLLVARNFLSDPRCLYSNYESLVGSHSRRPSAFIDDSTRSAVSGKLFGSYAEKIHYGVLSLNGKSLKNYGVVFLRLKNVAIEKRVSFLEDNSYTLLARLGQSFMESIPSGHRAWWGNKEQLVAAKLGSRIRMEDDQSVWENYLVESGGDRSSDLFIEAHIYGSFNAESVQEVKFADCEYSRTEKNDIDCIKDILGI